MNENSSFASIITEYQTLKKLRRTGWQLRGIRDCESLADHCYGVVLLSHLLCSHYNDLDYEKTIKTAIIHELGECRVGDIPYTALKYFSDKSEKEQSALADMMANTDEELKQETLELFKEFENGATKEARFVKAVDKLEMLLTATEYEKAGFSGLGDFWNNDFTFKCFSEFSELETMALELRKSRSERLKST